MQGGREGGKKGKGVREGGGGKVRDGGREGEEGTQELKDQPKGEDKRREGWVQGNLER